MTTEAPKLAVVYRMATPDHTCPYGLKSLDLLRREGYRVEDHLLDSVPAKDAFKAEHGVATTPQTFIDGVRIGGWDDLRRHFGKPVTDVAAPNYRPVIVVFVVAALLAMAVSWAATGRVFTVDGGQRFIAFAMCVLALLKLQDVEAFSSMFLGYDLLARRWVTYAYVYPYAELLAGVLMVAGALVWVAAPVALVIGGIGAASVFKAVYIDKRSLTCACVGGNAKVPLGFVSLTENLMMVAMAGWMIWRHA